MAAIDREQAIIERVLCERARFYAKPDEFRTLTVFDREQGQFLLTDEGWDGYERIHSTWAHIEVCDGKIWIQQDDTQDGLANDLIAAGIPQSQIVLGFKHPMMRPDTEFAIA
jgi:hypothetical protein